MQCFRVYFRKRNALDFQIHSARLCECDKDSVLVHGDFSGRNILIKANDANDKWIVAGILDWEFASVGSPLWDIASLFRYADRFSFEFRQRFADSYRRAGGTLPDDWWWTTRWLDAARLVKLPAQSDIPQRVIDDCRNLLRFRMSSELERMETRVRGAQLIS